MAKNDHEADQDLSPPNGCRWCGIEAYEHLQRWKPPVGWHQWEEPTVEQRKKRMLERRRRAKRGTGNLASSFTQPLAVARRILPATA
ncbi:hypothetical protein DPM19_34005 [Actinomadura craniellae]|uniref:Uncharacterized protein n=1 Tax=Actinomadura craniellae TaxID=2231787 RepID=A0A365GV57_9ACTN|nr:hypothetical protein DPM19_34005 [Actinomadura craniellae]